MKTLQIFYTNADGQHASTAPLPYRDEAEALRLTTQFVRANLLSVHEVAPIVLPPVSYYFRDP